MRQHRAHDAALLAALLGTASCVSGELASEPRDPANPGAVAATPAPQSSALNAGFEPFEAYGIAAREEATHAGHQHAAPTDAGAPMEPKGNLIYVCPMHPEVRRAEPGRCPKCGMTLEPRKVGN